MPQDSPATSFVLGYHGCDRETAEAVLAGEAGLSPSENDYDWLADGVYFWEHNATRAHEWACELRGRGKVETPAVVGAVIDLGRCLNLLDSLHLRMVKAAFDVLAAAAEAEGRALPENKGGPEKLLRLLDCYVIQSLHQQLEEAGEPAFDSVRAVFPEGDELFPGGGFRAKNHIQLAVRNPGRQILGYFRPLDDEGRVRVFG